MFECETGILDSQLFARTAFSTNTFTQTTFRPFVPKLPPRCARPSSHLALACMQLIVLLHARRPLDTDMAGVQHPPWSPPTLVNLKPIQAGMLYPVLPKETFKVSEAEQAMYATDLLVNAASAPTEPSFSFKLPLTPFYDNAALNNTECTDCEKKHLVQSVLEVAGYFTEVGCWPGACSRDTLCNAFY